MTWRQRLGEQGPAFAAAGVLTVLAVAAIELRMAEEWPTGMFLVTSLVPGVGVQLITAAGLAILGLAMSLVGELWVVSFAGTELIYAGRTGWELMSLLGGAGLVAYAVLRREPGPGYLGVATLFFFLIGTVGPNEDASLMGWPLVLVVLAVVAGAVALLRPRAA
ncbi:MAG TPA: hypothetical protein VEX36_06105 [Thermoleophilaceae bacterium]|nr:hypothetical protein [Thermoleophilaceae bacterium]